MANPCSPRGGEFGTDCYNLVIFETTHSDERLTQPVINQFNVRTIIVILFALVCWGGCSSPRGKRSAERMPPQPILTADQTFAETGLVVSAELGPFRRPLPEGKTTPTKPNEGGERGKGGERKGQRRPSGSGERGGPEARSNQGGGTRGVRATPMRQNLIVTVSNPTDSLISLSIASVRSLLGNFVAVPGSMTLEPGASQSLENMRANYPANFDSLELTIRIRTAETNETQILTLKLAPNQPSPPSRPTTR